MKLQQRGSDERGAAIVTVMLLVMIAGLLTTVTTKLAVHASEQSGEARERVASVHAAEAGVDWAVQQMSLVTGAQCGWAASPPTLPASSGPGQPAFTVTVTDSDPSGGCGDNPADLRRIIRSTGRDSDSGLVRTVESEVQLAAKYTAASGAFSFNDAIFSGDPYFLLISSGIDVIGDGGDNADIYTGFSGTGSAVSGDADIRGDYVARGGVDVGGSGKIRGDLWANGDVTIDGAGAVFGDVHARGNVVIKGGGHVYGDVYATGTVTITGGADLDGEAHPGYAVEAPPVRTLPTPPATYNTPDWPQPYRSFATCDEFDAWFHNSGGWSEAAEALTAAHRADVRGTYYVAQPGCAVQPGNSYRGMTLTGDTAIVTQGCFQMQGSASFTQASGADHKLSIISLHPGPSRCPDGNNNDGIRLAGGAWLKSVDTFLFAVNKVWVTGGVQIKGQIYANTVEVDGGFSMDFRKHEIGGFTSVSTPVHEGFTPKVLYLRQVD